MKNFPKGISTLAMFLFVAVFTFACVSTVSNSSNWRECRVESEGVMFSWDSDSREGWRTHYVNKDFGKNKLHVCLVRDTKTKQFYIALLVEKADVDGSFPSTMQIIKRYVSGYTYRQKWDLYNGKVEGKASLALKGGFSAEQYCFRSKFKMKGDDLWQNKQYIAVALVTDPTAPDLRYIFVMGPSNRLKEELRRPCSILIKFLKTFRRIEVSVSSTN